MEIQDSKLSPSGREHQLNTAPPAFPARSRYGPRTIVRFINLTLSALFVYVLVDGWVLPRWQLVRENITLLDSAWPTRHTPLETLESIMLDTPDEASIRGWSKYYTAGPHLAGKNLSQAIWTKEKWESFGIPNVQIVSYDIYTNYPIGHRLALLNTSTKSTVKKDGEAEAYELLYEASLKEDMLEEDPTSGLENSVPTFHGYSAK